MASIRHAGMQAVAGEVVHFVDVDRPREQRAEDAAGRILCRALDQRGDPAGVEIPAVGQHAARGAVTQQRPHERLMPGQLGQAHVFEWMTVGPVADVMQ